MVDKDTAATHGRPSTVESYNLKQLFTMFRGSIRLRRLSAKFGLPIVVVIGTIGIVGWNDASTPPSLLPDATITQMEFTPYFYRSDIPFGYSATPANMSYSRGLLSVRLTKPNSPDITISQQKLPNQLRPEDVLAAEKKLDVPFGVGTINQVEGRLLGSIVTDDPQPILILISSQSSENQAIVIALTEALTKVR